MIHNNSFLDLVKDALSRVKELDVHQLNNKIQNKEEIFMLGDQK